MSNCKHYSVCGSEAERGYGGLCAPCWMDTALDAPAAAPETWVEISPNSVWRKGLVSVVRNHWGARPWAIWFRGSHVRSGFARPSTAMAAAERYAATLESK